MNNIFRKNNRHLSADELSGYASGSLNSRERFVVERHLMDCEFCSEALEGIQGLSDAHRLFHIRREMRIQHGQQAGMRRKAISLPVKIAIIATIVILTILIMGVFLLFGQRGISSPVF